MRSPLPVLAVVAISLAACGGDDDTDSAASAPAPADTAAAATGATGSGTTAPAPDPASGATTVAASVPTIPLESVPGPTAPEFSGEGSEAVCALIAELDEADDGVDFDTMFDPETGPAYWESQFALMDELLDVAPAEILEPLEVVIEANHAWYDAIVAADWNLEEADASMIETPGVDQAGVTLDAYTTDVCGVGA